jgi:hypothetical protein
VLDTADVRDSDGDLDARGKRDSSGMNKKSSRATEAVVGPPSSDTSSPPRTATSRANTMSAGSFFSKPLLAESDQGR